jgi:hypothetical protein
LLLSWNLTWRHKIRDEINEFVRRLRERAPQCALRLLSRLRPYWTLTSGCDLTRTATTIARAFFGREQDQEIIIANLYAARLRETPRFACFVFRTWQSEKVLPALKEAILGAAQAAAKKEIKVDARDA